MSNDRIEPPDAIRQIEFRQLLVGFRKTVLIDALLDAVRGINLDELNAQIAQFVPSEARAVLAGAGIRDEHVFPTPVLLTAAPQLLGYY